MQCLYCYKRTKLLARSLSEDAQKARLKRKVVREMRSRSDARVQQIQMYSITETARCETTQLLQRDWTFSLIRGNVASLIPYYCTDKLCHQIGYIRVPANRSSVRGNLFHVHISHCASFSFY